MGNVWANGYNRRTIVGGAGGLGGKTAIGRCDTPCSGAVVAGAYICRHTYGCDVVWAATADGWHLTIGVVKTNVGGIVSRVYG